MTRIIKRMVMIFVILVVLCAVAFSVLFLYSPVPAKTSFTVSLEELRALVKDDGGFLPTSINVLNITDGEFPPGLVVPFYFAKMMVPCYVWQIAYSGKNSQTIMVDTACTKKHFTGISAHSVLYQNEYNLMQEALRRASKIVLTHEHYDHAGGAALSPYLDELLPKLWITPEQKSGPFMPGALFPEGALEKTQALEYDRVAKFAPGVVLIKTPGHTPGSQSLYIQLANGKEYILAGDIAWSMMNITIPRGRPLITSLVLGENRGQSANELRWLNGMQSKGLNILITHDTAHTESLAAQGLLKFGLE